MPQHFFDLGLIVPVAAFAAIILGWLRQLPMIGYVLAGVLLGPACWGIISGEEQIRFTAELGVVLLLFILGMELPLQSFRQSARVALLVTFGLIAISIGLLFVIGLVIDLTLGEKIVYGFIISLSSTAVAVKLLEAVGLRDKDSGQIAVSVLVAQDLAFVPMVMVLDAISGGQGNGAGGSLAIVPKLLFAVVVLVGLIAYLSKRQRVELFFHETVERYADLIPIAALAWCFMGAAVSETLGFSPGFGAFLAGLVIGNSTSKEIVLQRVEPMQHVFLMAFFLSIGMLLDFEVIRANVALIVLLLLGTLVFKTVTGLILLRLSLPDNRWRCSFVTSLTISQIGEFSFILAATALSNGILTEANYKIALAVIALSLVASPLWTAILNRFVTVAYKQTATCLSDALTRLITAKPSVVP